MMIATEKPGCSNFKKKNRFERAIALIHASSPKEIFLGRVLLDLGALVQNQVIRTDLQAPNQHTFRQKKILGPH